MLLLVQMVCLFIMEDVKSRLTEVKSVLLQFLLLYIPNGSLILSSVCLFSDSSSISNWAGVRYIERATGAFSSIEFVRRNIAVLKV